MQPKRDELFEYFGLKTLQDRYLTLHPVRRSPLETPQYFFMRVALGLGANITKTLQLYDLMSTLQYMPSTPTLFNSGTPRPQLSSCYLLDSPSDNLESIYKKYSDIALLSKYAGGIGVAFHRVRSRGSLIRGTNAFSNGVVPWLKTLDSSVSAVNQGGKRKGAACVYLESWHADIEEFLELRNGTGDENRRTHNLNLANWVPDLFMKRVEADAQWSLFDPKVMPDFCDLYGEDFERAYAKAEKAKKFVKQVRARDLYARMMTTLGQTGNGWITFKDAANKKCNQTGKSGVVHLSNLCTEIVEVTQQDETAVCNLGSINLARYISSRDFDYVKLRETVRIAVEFLDRVIDINFYPIGESKMSNGRWRPVGLGVMGLQDVFFQLNIGFDSEEARELSRNVQEHIYFYALEKSQELASQKGRFASFLESKSAQGLFQFDLWGVTPSSHLDWGGLRKKIKKKGLRNSLLIALAPTATISSICGCNESIEPQVSNLFKRETLSGEFMMVNSYLVEHLKSLGMWNEKTRNAIKSANGSVQDFENLPAPLRTVFRTAWEVPMRSVIDMAADRGPFIDQSQSLNLFVEMPTMEKLSAMYFHAWRSGLKTTYYLRSRPATGIAKVTLGPLARESELENPEVCEVCQ